MGITNNNTWRIMKEMGIKKAISHRTSKVLRGNILIDMFMPIAWKLGLELPKGYKFLYIASHGTGHNAMQRFLYKCGINTNWHFYEDGYTRYREIYTRLIRDNKHYNIISISEYNFKDYQKFFSTIKDKIKAISLVRDPISICKSSINHSLERNNTQEIVMGGGGNLSAIFKDCIKYQHYNPQTGQIHLANNPCLDQLEHLFSGRIQMQDMQGMFVTNDIIKSIPSISEVHYIDMSQIIGSKTYNTMNELSHKFGFPPPKDKHYFEGSLYGELRAFLPIRFHIPITDGQVELVCNLQQHNLTLNEYKHDVTLQLMPNSYKDDKNFSHVKIYATNKTLEKLQDNRNICLTKKELENLFDVVQKEMLCNNAKKLKESDVLTYLSQNPKLAKSLKAILDNELSHIKQTRLDIIESWKYYLEFEAICEEFDIKQ